MNICIPVIEDKGMESPVCGHFGSAPMFLVVDSESGACRALPNRDLHHGHGMCQPLASLNGERLDGVVVGAIGMRALDKLNAAGIRVYLAEHATVAGVVEAVKSGALRPMSADMACAHHGQGHR